MTTAGDGQVAEQLTSAQCLELLGRNDFGRLAVVLDDGQPDLFPVNYVLDGDRVVFRSLAGTKLDHAALARVAFEIDERTDDGGGVSVVVKGVGREITTAMDPDSERQRGSSETPLQGDHWVRIVPSDITGRRVSAPPGRA